MISNNRRKNQIDILSLDPVLLEDIHQRLEVLPELKDFTLRRPEVSEGAIDVEQFHRLAPGTMCARLIILDVRRLALPQAQAAYNKIVGYNRRDFNRYCRTLLISDGPAMLFSPGTDLELFCPVLARCRVDYHAGAFFYDPFLHYVEDERQNLGLDYRPEMLDRIPVRLAGYFRGGVASVPEVRAYYRAATYPKQQRLEKSRQRLQSLSELLRDRLRHWVPSQTAALTAMIGREGYRFPGESLPLNVYPFSFEDRVLDLLEAPAAARVQ